MLILLVADGATPETLRTLMDAGELPALARLRGEGGERTITTVFPSVTGPAYTPFLMGRFPGAVGLPGLRWFDRSRRRCTYPDYSRSYVGAELRYLAGDLSARSPTMFELVERKVASMSMIDRGLRSTERLDNGMRFMLRTARTHFAGDVAGWLAIDRKLGRAFAARVRRERPQFAFAAFTSIDKASHGVGQAASLAADCFRSVDDAVRRIRHDAERLGYWRELHLWVVSDHGHAGVTRHEDLAGWLGRRGLRVRAHPWVYRRNCDVAVMVSGNAMAHLYVDLDRRARPWWPALAPRWEELASALLERSSVDLLLLPLSRGACEIRSRASGRAVLVCRGGRYRYLPVTGDPLGVGELGPLNSDEAHAAMAGSRYPDALVQISSLASSSRAGDMIISAGAGWDFRARYEPIPHVSSHGSLRSEHMLVPFIHNRPVTRGPSRTADLMPTGCALLGIRPPSVLDGRPFV